MKTERHKKFLISNLFCHCWDLIYPFSSNTMSCELFDCYSIWVGGFLMVQKVGEINLFFSTFVNKTTMDSFTCSLFHQRFEPLKTHQTISNSNHTIHKTLYLMKMDKSGPKNNNFGSLI